MKLKYSKNFLLYFLHYLIIQILAVYNSIIQDLYFSPIFLPVFIGFNLFIWLIIIIL